MRKIFWLAMLAVPLIVVVTLPARMIVPRLDVPDEVRDVQGTLWRGQARWHQPGYVPLDLDWHWDGGRTWRWRALGGETDLSGIWRPAATGLDLADVTGVVEMERVDANLWFLNTRPRGYLELDIQTARIPEGKPPAVSGRIVWREARLVGTVHESLGEIVIELTDGPNGQAARVASRRPAPIQVRGTIGLDAERYTVDLWLRASTDRPELARQLAWLGEPQPDGQVRVRLEGALGW